MRLIKGADGIVRGAMLKYHKKGKEQIVSRPLQLLYPLEISERFQDAADGAGADGAVADGAVADGAGADGAGADGAGADGAGADGAGADGVGAGIANTDNVFANDSTDEIDDDDDSSQLRNDLNPLNADDSDHNSADHNADNDLDTVIKGCSLRSKRAAAMDGQIRRRLLKQM